MHSRFSFLVPSNWKELFWLKTLFELLAVFRDIQHQQVQTLSFFVTGITKINKDFFNRVAPIKSLYTVVGFQFKFTKNPFQSKEELSKEELSWMCQHNTSRLRSQQPMVRPLYLQELNLRFYTSLSPSQEYFSFVHLGVTVVNKQIWSFKENCSSANQVVIKCDLVWLSSFGVIKCN